MDKQAQPKPPSKVAPGTYISTGERGFRWTIRALREGDELWVGDVLCVRRGDEAVAVNTCAKLGHILGLPNVYLFRPKLRIPDGLVLFYEPSRPGLNANALRDMVSELYLVKHDKFHKAWNHVFGDDPGKLVMVGPSVLGFEPFRQYPMFCAAGVPDISTQGIIMKKQSILGMADALLKKDGLLEYEEVNGMVHKFATVGGLVSHLRNVIAHLLTSMKLDAAAAEKTIDDMQTSLDTECAEHEEEVAKLKAVQDAVATIGSNALDKLRIGLTEELAPEWVRLDAPLNLKTFDDRSKYIAEHGVDPCDGEITDTVKYVARLMLLRIDQYVYLDGMLHQVTEAGSSNRYPSWRPIHGGQNTYLAMVDSRRVLFVKDALQKVSAPVPPTPKTHDYRPEIIRGISEVIAAGASLDKLDICVSKSVAASISEHLGVATFGTFEGIPVSVEASMKAAWFIRGMDSGGTKMRLFTGLNHREIGDKHQASMHRRWDRTESTIGVVTRDDVVVVKVTKWCSTTKECLTEAAQKLNAAERIMS